MGKGGGNFFKNAWKDIENFGKQVENFGDNITGETQREAAKEAKKEIDAEAARRALDMMLGRKQTERADRAASLNTAAIRATSSIKAQATPSPVTGLSSSMSEKDFLGL